MTNTPYIAFTVLFSWIKNRNVDIAYSNWKNTQIFPSVRETLLKFGYNSPQVRFKCIVVWKQYKNKLRSLGQ